MSRSSMGRRLTTPRKGELVVRILVGGRRWTATVAAVAVSIAAVATVAPGSSGAAPSQEGPNESSDSDDDALVAIDVDVADGDAAALTGALDEVQANVALQLKQLSDAEAAVQAALTKLAEADTAIQLTQEKIDELTNASDSVVVTRYMNPPSEEAVEALSADSVSDATVKQAILEMRADEDADKLNELTSARADLKVQQEEQEKVKADADKATTAAEAALADVQAAVGQQTQFVLDIKQWMSDPEGARKLAGSSPDAAAQMGDVIAELTNKLNELEQAEQAREAEAAEMAARQRELRGGFTCPLDGSMSFVDTWGAARSGGRSHKGTDMMAARGTNVVAPANGRVVHSSNSLGGLSFHLYADDGHSYYGTHMQSYENVGVGWVAAGTLIGHVGTSGNAPDNAPHLHFEYHPNGGAAVNPYSRLTEVCDRS